MATRRRFGVTWWGQRWLGALESFGWESRLARGRSYASGGQVRSLAVESGLVQARVQGSRPSPYRVAIRLAPLTEEQWERALDELAAQAIFTARLLAGELPAEVEAIFRQAGAPLFPSQAEALGGDCTCPDWGNPCKHIAAVHYVLAEEIDHDPFTLFRLRGRGREEVLAALRQRRAAGDEEGDESGEASAGRDEARSSSIQPDAPAPSAPEALPLASFWSAGAGLEAFAAAPRPPQVPRAVLRRLGVPPFARNDPLVWPLLASAYDAIAEQALIVANASQTSGE